MTVPGFAKNLYADLRDRRLLPLVVALILGMVAVPVLLTSDAPPPPPSATDTADVPEGAPSAAVLISDQGVRNYRDRLDKLRSKNPFARDEADQPDVAESSIQDVSEDGDTGSGTGDSTSFSETLEETVTASTSGGSSAPAPPDDVTVEVDEAGGGNAAGASGGGDPDPDEGRWYSYTVDVRTGLAGDVRERKNLQGPTVLPSRANPVAIYIGVADAGKSAMFMVSPDVVDTRGDGRCMPAPSNCQFLVLRKGNEQRIQYAPRGEPDTYVLSLEDITLEPVKEPPEVDGARSAQVGATAGAFLAP